MALRLNVIGETHFACSLGTLRSWRVCLSRSTSSRLLMQLAVAQSKCSSYLLSFLLANGRLRTMPHTRRYLIFTRSITMLLSNINRSPNHWSSCAYSWMIAQILHLKLFEVIQILFFHLLPIWQLVSFSRLLWRVWLRACFAWCSGTRAWSFIV